MARMPRLVIPGQPMHIVQRGNNRQATFFADEDYRYYLDALRIAIKEYPVKVHAYVLMTNHVHLVLTPEAEDALSRFMQSVGRRYVRYVNRVYKRSGTLWEGRYRSAVIDSDAYLLKCYRYVEMNPVRAGMVAEPHDYAWSSFGGNALGKVDEVLYAHEIYNSLGMDNAQRQNNYLSLFKQYLSSADMRELREGTEKKNVIGRSHFSDEIESMLQRRVNPGRHGGDHKCEKFKNK